MNPAPTDELDAHGEDVAAEGPRGTPTSACQASDTGPRSEGPGGADDAFSRPRKRVEHSVRSFRRPRNPESLRGVMMSLTAVRSLPSMSISTNSG